jgi:hypothetical protein
MTQSSIDPTQPAPYSEGLSASVRGNFAAAANDVNALWTAIGQNGPVLNPGVVLAGPITGTSYSSFRQLSASDIPNLSPGQITGLGSAALKNTTNVNLTNVAAVSGAINTGHVAVFADGVGTVSDGGLLGSAAYKTATNASLVGVASVSGAITAGHIATFADTAGTVQDGGTIGTLATQNANAVAITGGAINGTSIGGTTPAAGSFTAFSASGAVSGAGLSAYMASPPAIGSTAANSGAFTTLSASGTISGTGFSNYLASPPAIGSTTAASGAFTTLSASSTISGTGFSAYLASPPAIGGTAPAAGAFTMLSATGAVSGVGFTTLFASPPPLGGTTANSGAFTTLSASGTISGAGFSTYLASPSAIGLTAANSGAFTTLSASGTVSGAGFSIYLASPPAIGSTAANSGAFTTFKASGQALLADSASAAAQVYTNPAGGTYTPAVQYGGVAANRASAAITAWGTGGSAGHILAASASATVGTNSALSSGAGIGFIEFEGDSGTGFNSAARILATVSGTVSAGVVPGQLMLYTANTSGVLVPALRITNAQQIQILSGGLQLPGGTLASTAAALTNSAGASTATLTNSPTAGNPTKWIPINDNGTIRNIPAW